MFRFIDQSGKEHSLADVTKFAAAVRSGAIRENTLVWSRSLEKWVPASQLDVFQLASGEAVFHSTGDRQSGEYISAAGESKRQRRNAEDRKWRVVNEAYGGLELSTAELVERIRNGGLPEVVRVQAEGMWVAVPAVTHPELARLLGRSYPTMASSPPVAGLELGASNPAAELTFSKPTTKTHEWRGWLYIRLQVAFALLVVVGVLLALLLPKSEPTTLGLAALSFVGAAIVVIPNLVVAYGVSHFKPYGRIGALILSYLGALSALRALIAPENRVQWWAALLALPLLVGFIHYFHTRQSLFEKRALSTVGGGSEEAE